MNKTDKGMPVKHFIETCVECETFYGICPAIEDEADCKPENVYERYDVNEGIAQMDVGKTRGTHSYPWHIPFWFVN